MSDLGQTIAPKSDQLNADDLIGGPRTIKITGAKVTGNSTDPQPASISFEDDSGKPYKPCKSMRRVMVQIWGGDTREYAGRKMTLYLDPKVKFGGQEVGGIRISHMTGINSKVTLALTVSKARRAMFTVQPLADDVPYHGQKSAYQGLLPEIELHNGSISNFGDWDSAQSVVSKFKITDNLDVLTGIRDRNIERFKDWRGAGKTHAADLIEVALEERIAELSGA